MEEINLVRIPRGSFVTKEQSDLLYEIAKMPLSDWIANNCIGCVYENIDDTSDSISQCVSCSRMNDCAKHDYFMMR